MPWLNMLKTSIPYHALPVPDRMLALCFRWNQLPVRIVILTHARRALYRPVLQKIQETEGHADMEVLWRWLERAAREHWGLRSMQTARSRLTQAHCPRALRSAAQADGVFGWVERWNLDWRLSSMLPESSEVYGSCRRCARQRQRVDR